MAVPASVMVAASLIGLLATACTGSSPAPARSTSAQGVPPIRYAAGVFDCPADHFVHVFGGHVYPMGYPARPPASARPDRCFETPQGAFAAGFTLAPLPSGFRNVGGQYLEPTPHPLLRRCAAAAGVVGFRVPCPRLIPFNAIPQLFPSRGQFVLEMSGFDAPSTYPRTAPGGYDLPHHMFVMAAEPRLSRYVTSCTGGRPSGRTVVHGLRARWITCPEGSEMNSGHVVLAWVQGGIDYAVTIHGDFPLTRMIAAAVAGAVRIER